MFSLKTKSSLEFSTDYAESQRKRERTSDREGERKSGSLLSTAVQGDILGSHFSANTFHFSVIPFSVKVYLLLYNTQLPSLLLVLPLLARSGIHGNRGKREERTEGWIR